MQKYRFDGRSVAEFKNDIKVCHAIEAELAIRLCIYLYQQSKAWPTIEPVQASFNGDYLEKPSDVNILPDFVVEEKLIEITHSGPLCKWCFHEKVSKTDYIIDNGHNMLFVNGIDELEEPEFVLMDHKQLKALTDKSIKQYGIRLMPGTKRKAYKYNTKWIENWKTLPKLVDNIPDSYSRILRAAQ